MKPSTLFWIVLFVIFFGVIFFGSESIFCFFLVSLFFIAYLSYVNSSHLRFKEKKYNGRYLFHIIYFLYFLGIKIFNNYLNEKFS